MNSSQIRKSKRRRGPLTVLSGVAVVHLVSFAALVAKLESESGTSTSFEAGLPYFLPFLVLSGFLAIGIPVGLSAIRRNELLAPRQRLRWSGLVIALPHSIAVYWWLHIRGTRP